MLRLLLFSFVCLFTAGASAQESLSYSFQLDTTGAVPALVVDLRFRGADSGVTHLQLPDAFAGQEQLYRALVGLEVRSSGVVVMGADSSLRTLRHRPNAAVHLRYRLQQDWHGPLHVPQNNRAIIGTDYLHATGYALLVIPRLHDTDRVQVSLNWTAMPRKWQVANSFHTGSRTYTGKQRYADLRNALFVAGDYRLYQAAADGQVVHLAIRGTSWQFTDTAALSAVAKVMTTQHRFWQDAGEPYFLVTLTPLAGNHSYNGSALYHSFLACITTEETLGSTFYWLLAHEYFHRWNGGLITLQGNEREHTWFTEGFTEYYAYSLLYRAGLMDLDRYVANANSILRDYYLSPVRNHDKVTAGRNFWQRREYQDLPYRKGFVYALYLDRLITSRSQGAYTLDSLMLALGRRAQQGQQPNDEMIMDLVRSYTGADLAGQHHRFIDEGATIPVLPGSMGPGVADTVETLPVYELGFDFNASAKQMVLTGVVENSAAWKAGLRNGQKLKDASVQLNNMAAPAVLRVEKEGQLTEVRYQPIAAERVAVPQFRVRKKD